MAPLLIAALATLAADDGPSFTREVAPILVKRCLGCHDERKPAAGLSMRTLADLKTGGKGQGADILVPGDPESSGLIASVREGAEPRMPYKLPPLAKAEIATLEAWVKAGAKADSGSGDVALRELVRPESVLPSVAVKNRNSEPVRALAVSPDGKQIAAAVGDRVILYDGASAAPTGILPIGIPINAVLFTPGGDRLIACGGEPGHPGAVFVLDIASKRPISTFRGHSDAILAADLAPDGQTLATASYDRLIKLWRLDAGRERHTLKEHIDAVYDVAFAPDGKTIASAAGDRTIKLWDAATGARRVTLGDSTAEVRSVVFGPGDLAIGAGADRSLRAWSVKGDAASLVKTAFAHDAPVIRLAVSRDRSLVASSGEDRAVKVWDARTLSPIATIDGGSDWPLALAFAPDASALFVGRYDGSIDRFESRTGKRLGTIRKAYGRDAPKAAALTPPASLDPLSPRGGTIGAKVRMTLTGNGVGDAEAVVPSDPALRVEILPRKKSDPRRLDIDLTVPTDVRASIHTLAARTPLGTTPAQPFAVAIEPEAAEKEPNEETSRATSVSLPATITGVIEKPGDRDRFRFAAKRGETLVFDMTARAIGSPLIGQMRVEGPDGRSLASALASGGRPDPVLVFEPPADGEYGLAIEDADLGGSGGHLYRVRAGAVPLAHDVFPLGITAGGSRDVAIRGVNLAKSSVSLSAGGLSPGGLLPIPDVTTFSGPSALRMVAADGPQIVEAEGGGDTPAGDVQIPGGASGRIDADGDSDVFRFRARKGQRLVVETFARRLGTLADTALEILDERGRPLPRAVLRPVEETNVAFRDHPSAGRNVRLTRWEGFAVGDYLLFGRELTRIEELPRNPDDDAIMWGTGVPRKGGQRVALLGTTPEHHPYMQPIYKVEVHPPGVTFPKAKVAPVTLFHRNDDGGPGYGADSRLEFDPPADGVYLVRVEDARGQGGPRHGYHLVIREPRPDFSLAISSESPNIPRGGTSLLEVEATRIDGFPGPIDLKLDGLPPGITAEVTRIEADSSTASILLAADQDAPAFPSENWTLTGTARGPDGRGVSHELDPGGPHSGLVTVRPEPPLAVRALSDEVRIRPGGQAELTLEADRVAGFPNRVPVEIRNLPRGVRVLDIGLNGVLITEKETRRKVVLQADPWAAPVSRSFFAVGTCEPTVTEHSSPPIRLVVEPAEAGPR